MIPIERLHNLGFMFQEIRDWQLKKLIENEIDLGFFIRSSVARTLYLDKYYSMTMLRGLLPIEKLNKEEKMYYWKETEGHAESKEDRIELVKILYVIEKIIVKNNPEI
jgi:hypothetical protein